jgi:transcriptional regulator with XRE-family HTH domain
MAAKRESAPDPADHGVAGRVAQLVQREEARGGSARSLSIRAGLAAGHVWAIAKGERGKREVTRSVLEKIAAAAEVPLPWLVAGHGSIDDRIVPEALYKPLPERQPEPPELGTRPSSYPRRDQAIEMLRSYSVRSKDPLLAVVIAGLEHENPPEDLELEAWFARARELEELAKTFLVRKALVVGPSVWALGQGRRGGRGRGARDRGRRRVGARVQCGRQPRPPLGWHHHDEVGGDARGALAIDGLGLWGLSEAIAQITAVAADRSPRLAQAGGERAPPGRVVVHHRS